MSRMWLGAVFINTAFSRVCALNEKDFLFEVSNKMELSSALEDKIRALLSRVSGSSIPYTMPINDITQLAEQIPQVPFDSLQRDDYLPGLIAWELSDPPPNFIKSSKSFKREPLSSDVKWKVNHDAWTTLLELRDLTERITLNIPITEPLTYPSKSAPSFSDNDRPQHNLLTSFGLENNAEATNHSTKIPSSSPSSTSNSLPPSPEQHHAPRVPRPLNPIKESEVEFDLEEDVEAGQEGEIDPDDSCSNTGACEVEEYEIIKNVLIRAGVTVRYVSPALMSLFLEARSRCLV